MTNFLNVNDAASSAVPGGQLRSYRTPLVLIVEDHEDTRFMLRTFLEMRGLFVAEAEDGEAGVRMAEEIKPDLILMDMSLPRLDGLAATHLIRGSGSLCHIPVAMLSGHAAPQSQEAALAAGCTDYLVKPLDFDHLVRILLRHLPTRHISATTDEKRAFERNLL